MRAEALRRNVTGTWGAAGEAWLDGLPGLLRRLAADWGLTLGEPYELTYHYVTAVTCADGSPAVLKAGFELDGELAALAAYDGHGAARLLRADPAAGALLLEQVRPGDRLRDLVPHDDAGAVAVLAEVMGRLHRPAAGQLPPVLSQVGALERHRGGTVPAAWAASAAALMRSLCASATREVLLHGDLHHDNVLRAAREPWLAIDPHGLAGDPGYEVGSVLFNPDPADRDPALTALVPARLERFATLLGEPVQRLAAWGFVKAVLSQVWTDAAGGGPTRALDVAALLRAGEQ